MKRPLLPDHLHPGASWSVGCRVSEKLAARFAELTGDRSALHSSEAFARRSIYRKPVVHGMLPVGFLAALHCFRSPERMCVPVLINGQFMRPLFFDDPLLLSAAVKELQPDEGKAEFVYQVRNANSGVVATQGTLTAMYTQEINGSTSKIEKSGASVRMPLASLVEQNIGFEKVEPGNQDVFDFRISDPAIQTFLDILSEGMESNETTPLTLKDGTFHFSNLLSIMLFSTSVGMLLPGRSATFLEFSAKIDRLIESDMLYRLKGTVTHVSRATRIIKKDLSIYRPEDEQPPSVTGKAVILVNAPQKNMPSVQSLRETALDMGLKGKVALITGGSRGIGETTAKLLALFGTKVVINYNKGSDDANRIVDEIRSEGGEALAVQADITDDAQVRSMVQRGKQEFGAIHILVNNAVRDYRPIPFLKLTWEELQKDLDVAVKGAFYCSHAVIPLLLEQGGGKIINISSVAVDNPPPDQTKYVVSKSALVGLTRSLAAEFAAKNIQINLVVPNFVETDLVAYIPESFRKKIALETPMGRNASSVEISHAVLFLASSYASFTTGQKIMVTGGGPPYL